MSADTPQNHEKLNHDKLNHDKLSHDELIISHDYPRPQLQRYEWTSLNGPWEFALDRDAQWSRPNEVPFDRVITVPFSPETQASGIADSGFYRAVWYRREVLIIRNDPCYRVILHFGAVDYAATVWVNGSLACQHEGGYTPFDTDVTDLLAPDGKAVIVVRAEDDASDLSKPRGKQDWMLDPHSIWYFRTSGIWQTVWYECVPQSWIGYIRWTPSLERWEIGLEARIDGRREQSLRLNVRLHVGNLLVADDTYHVVSSEVHRRIALSDPGIDDYRNDLLWSPQSPTLIQAELRLIDARNEILDEVHSYTALRSIGVQGDRFVLNGRPYPLRMVLDQGYWPATGLTSPDGDALRADVELAKAMGFNGVRKHQKIEDPRYLYWADALGLLVWEEMPSAYRFNRDSIHRLTQGMDRRNPARRQPSLHRGVGAVQRIVGSARSAGQPFAAALRAGALSPDENARSHPPGYRQRWMGERRDGHYRHSRLRRRVRSASGSAMASTKSRAGSSSAKGREAACFCSKGRSRRTSPLC